MKRAIHLKSKIMKTIQTLTKHIDKSKTAVFLETNRFDKDNKSSLLFIKPKKIITAYKGQGLKEKIKEIEVYLRKGYYAAGFISYEAGYFFEEKLFNNKKYKFPLLWFGLFNKPLVLTKALRDKQKEKNILLEQKKLNIDYRRYKKDIKKIKSYIEKGDVYQINYTFKDKFKYSGDWANLYLSLRNTQKVSYSAVIKFNNNIILSFSPELFFRKNKKLIETRPMKGTYRRGRNSDEDKKHISSLKDSTKDRSENVMIVDLLRNDFGRISDSGSIEAKELFKVEKYETLFQMISIVRGKLKNNLEVYDIFKNTFPCGSVTGAPKIRAMEIIREIEKEPRGVYTGSIGYISPQRKAVFNVAIRTLVLDDEKKEAEMGLGSGIVYDSLAESEYRECLLKADFTKYPKVTFKLIETMLLKENGKIYLLKYHLKRLKNSSKYFDFCYNEGVIKNSLVKYVNKLENNKKYRLRLLLDKDGRLEISHNPYRESSQEILKADISEKKVDSQDIFLYHKTTSRTLYDNEYKRAQKKGLDEVFFLNERNQVTEGCISNIIVKKGCFYYTPPVECGLLDGVYRQHLLNRKNFPLKEKVLYKKDLFKADKIYISNSLRGLKEIELIRKQ